MLVVIVDEALRGGHCKLLLIVLAFSNLSIGSHRKPNPWLATFTFWFGKNQKSSREGKKCDGGAPGHRGVVHQNYMEIPHRLPGLILHSLLAS